MASSFRALIYALVSIGFLVFLVTTRIAAGPDPGPGPEPDPEPDPPVPCEIPVWPEYSLLTANGSLPDVSGDTVVWQEHDGHDYEIYRWQNCTITNITLNDQNDHAPAISGDDVVYTRGIYDVVFYDGHTLAHTPISAGNTVPAWPSISEGRVVWEEDPNTPSPPDYNVIFWGGTYETLSLQPGFEDATRPDISGDDVVWQALGSTWDIFWWDGVFPIQTFSAENVSAYYDHPYGAHDMNPRVSNGYAVWERCILNSVEPLVVDYCHIYQKFLVSGGGGIPRPLTLVTEYARSPDISSWGVVYGADLPIPDGAIPVIYFWDGSETTQISDFAAGLAFDPRIDGGSIVWSNRAGEVYFTTLPVSMPEPTGGLLAACSFGVLAALARRRRA